MPLLSELTINVDSALNILPSDLFSSRCYYVTARYPTEPVEQPQRRQPQKEQAGNSTSSSQKANPQQGGRCVDCVFHVKIKLPCDVAQTIVLVSLWEVDDKIGDVLVGEAAVPLDDPRAVEATNPWPLLRSPENDDEDEEDPASSAARIINSRPSEKYPPMLTLLVVADQRRTRTQKLGQKSLPPEAEEHFLSLQAAGGGAGNFDSAEEN